MKEMLIILFSAILVDNFVLSRFLGICPFLGVSRNLKTAMGMSFAVIAVMLMATALTWPIYTFLLLPLKLSYLQTVIFILVIAALVQIIETFLKKSVPSLYRALGIYLPLITTNCAVLGVTILNIDPAKHYDFLQAMVNSLGAGVGFMLALFLFSGVRSKVDHADIPKFMKGLPITLVSAGLVSISFFKGLIEKLFS
jgi:electron transport complex protein RnfA